MHAVEQSPLHAGLLLNQHPRIYGPLELFVSQNAIRFYGFPEPSESIEMVRDCWVVPDLFTLPTGQQYLLCSAGETLNWRRKGLRSALAQLVLGPLVRGY